MRGLVGRISELIPGCGKRRGEIAHFLLPRGILAHNLFFDLLPATAGMARRNTISYEQYVARIRPALELQLEPVLTPPSGLESTPRASLRVAADSHRSPIPFRRHPVRPLPSAISFLMNRFELGNFEIPPSRDVRASLLKCLRRDEDR